MAERMSTEGMRYVRAVAETGSFSAAAKSYGVTQPALSNGIAKLEATLGEKLFDRSPRGVTPTAFGETMLPRIERALAAIDDVHAEANRWNAPVPDAIRVGVSPLIDPKLVASAYRAVCDQPGDNSSYQLVLREANMSELRESLVSGDLDLIVVPSVEPMPRYAHRVIDSEPLVLVDSRPEDGPVKLDALAGRQLILLPDTCGLTTFTRSLIADNHLPVNAYPGEAGSYRVLEEWSHLGLGSAMLPKSKLASPDAPHREVLDTEGGILEIFYETIWNPTSPIADDLEDLANRLVQPKA
ncbi:LysR family transcriptional regulator [Corynebacterium sp. CNJ-954]|uniref:LysR family transcriptional regulator n=1 Tax=Corynebacterium sp. CNJ-954 TaxID=1904962 RepID=UPI00095FDE56|nr:LysR family transcriptional regulator [Corynebacterium sp. CNJ-954]OLT54203.1 LysR family transcriptional regulator [Corynebacterium sp. CNJ-954]